MGSWSHGLSCRRGGGRRGEGGLRWGTARRGWRGGESRDVSCVRVLYHTAPRLPSQGGRGSGEHWARNMSGSQQKSRAENPGPCY